MSRVLVACEHTGAVRDAFAALGHDAWSCDLLETETPGNHYRCDVLEVLGYGWDLMIAHPPCTYLAASGLHWNKRDASRVQKSRDGIAFVSALMAAPIPRVAIENPVGCISSCIGRPTQIIQPFQFGHDASKKTCLWLRGLPELAPTTFVPPGANGRYSNQTSSGQNNLSPGPDRWKLRSATYAGIARAMAEQWGPLLDRPLGQQYLPGTERIGKRPAWERCPCCENFLCNIHGVHAHECPCPPIEEWDIDPYSEGA